MRILVINWRCMKNPLAGGAEIYLQEIFRRIVGRGHEVTQLAERFAGSLPDEYLDGIRVQRLGGGHTFNFAVWRALPAIVANGAYDIVIDDLNKIPFYSPWRTGKPVLAILMHLFRGSIFRETIPPLAAYVWLAETAIPLAYRNCPFAVLSESSKKDTVRVGIPAEHIAVIPPGTDFSRFAPAPRPPSLDPVPVVLHVGRLKKYKAVDHLLRAARLLLDRGRKLRVVIVGGGDDRPRLEAVAAKLNLGDADNHNPQFAAAVEQQARDTQEIVDRLVLLE
ncbi:MAG: glycosyltransferase family 4 protein, partial [bacterium]